MTNAVGVSDVINEWPQLRLILFQVRKEDVRSFEKDRVEMYKSFRPGDIVLARVLSLGEASSGYFLAHLYCQDLNEDSSDTGNFRIMDCKCCVFRPAIVYCAHRKAGRPTFFQPFSAFFVHFKPFSVISRLKSTRNI